MAKELEITCDHCHKAVLSAARIEVVFYRRVWQDPESVDATYDFCSNACAGNAILGWQGIVGKEAALADLEGGE